MDTRLVALCQAMDQIVRGKSEAIALLIMAMLAEGHVLLEDVPGTGKTTLARALALLTGAHFQRVQFTPDLMPTDLTGGAVFMPQRGEFEIRKGPVFAQILLADEINRASPRTQSALLEAMEEGQVSLEGTSHRLPRPFLVLATQNPVEFHGVYPLPEAQMDRFLVRMELGYPNTETEIGLLDLHRTGGALEQAQALLTSDDILALQAQVRQVHLDPALARYIVELAQATRSDVRVRLGVSPRGAMALGRLARARALLQGRDHVLPEDIQFGLVPVFAHRIVLQEGQGVGLATRLLEDLRQRVRVPV